MTVRESAASALPGKGAKGCGCIGGLAVLLFAAVMTTTIVGIGIWPGEAKLVAPLLCPDDQPDAFVVSDTYNVRPGETVTEFTLYCVGERGNYTDVGFFKPMALLTLLHLGLWSLIPIALILTGFMKGAKTRARGETIEASDLVPPGDSTPPATTDPSAWGASPQNPIVSGGVDDGPIIDG